MERVEVAWLVPCMVSATARQADLKVRLYESHSTWQVDLKVRLYECRRTGLDDASTSTATTL